MRQKLLVLFIILIFIFLPRLCFAVENSSNNETSVSEKLLEAKEKSKTNSIKESLKEYSEGYSEKEQLGKITESADNLGNNFWLIAQSFTWPMFIYGISAGMFILLLGVIIGIRGMRSVGIWLCIGSILQLIVINFAPEIAESLISLVIQI